MSEETIVVNPEQKETKMKTIREKVKSNAALLAVGAALLGFQVYSMSKSDPKVEAPQAQAAPQQPQVVYLPQQIGQQQISQVPGTMQGSFKIAGGYLTQNGLLLLNDMSDYKAANCRTLVIDTNTLPQFKGQSANSLKGKIVTFQATNDEYKGKAQLKAVTATISQ